jgi:hypothetical protein
MILYKTIALQYGSYLAAQQEGGKFDPLGHTNHSDQVRALRQDILKDLSSARIYLLDRRAANYLDSLRTDVQGTPRETEAEVQIRDYVQEIEFPKELVWIEFDSRQLWEDRISRGLAALSQEALSNWHQRGFLFDNRSLDAMTVRLFSAVNDRSFLDSPLSLVLKKSRGGQPEFDSASWHVQDCVISALFELGFGDQLESARAFIEEHKGHLSYEMIIGFMLFAALAAREDDLLSKEAPSLTPAQMKTARKFGKTWMIETLRSHITVRIGPGGERHLTEYEARRQFEAARSSGRASPTEHWVSEHERRYANGKVVRIRPHKRGQTANRELPVRVVGPRIGEGTVPKFRV